MTKPLDLQGGSAPGSPKLVTPGRVLTTDARDSAYCRALTSATVGIGDGTRPPDAPVISG